jgi:hypothetical protein
VICLAQKRLFEKESLDKSTGKGDHREASVDDLLHVAFLDLVGGQLLEQTSIKADVSGRTITVVLHEVGSLKDSNEKEDLKVSGETNRANGTKGVGVGELGSRKVDSGLLGDHTNNGEHADASVFDLGPTGVVQVGLDIGKSHGVKSHITRHGSIELVGLDQERDGLGHFLGIQGSDSPGLTIGIKGEQEVSQYIY